MMGLMVVVLEGPIEGYVMEIVEAVPKAREVRTVVEETKRLWCVWLLPSVDPQVHQTAVWTPCITDGIFAFNGLSSRRVNHSIAR